MLKHEKSTAIDQEAAKEGHGFHMPIGGTVMHNDMADQDLEIFYKMVEIVREKGIWEGSYNNARTFSLLGKEVFLVEDQGFTAIYVEDFLEFCIAAGHFL